jgi:phosphotransacetylase
MLIIIINFVNAEIRKMAKKTQTQAKKTVASKSGEKGKAAEYTDYLLELHKLQGVLLTDLKKELRPVR